MVAMRAGLKIFVEMRTESALQHPSQKMYVSISLQPTFFPATESCVA
jgi:hypothetical protein